MAATGTSIQKENVEKELANLYHDYKAGTPYSPEKLAENRKRLLYLEQRHAWLEDRERRGIPDTFIPR